MFAKIWNWLNGNKTVIGLVVSKIASSIPPDTSVGPIPVQPILAWLGDALIGVGVVHKMVKANAQPGPNQ